MENGGKGILKALLRDTCHVPVQRPSRALRFRCAAGSPARERTDVLDDLHHAESLLDTGWFHSRGSSSL